MKQLNWYQIFGQQVPDGRTITPTDDIQIWLHCANIWNKAYTTLAEVLADTTTLAKLIASNNAIDYLVRSTTWAGTNLVPIMTDNTHPSGECFASSTTVEPYRAFDNNGSSTWYGIAGSPVNSYVGYKFPTATKIAHIEGLAYINTSAVRTYTVKIQGSNDNFVNDIHDLTSAVQYTGTQSDTVKYDTYITSIAAYLSYRLICTAVSDASSTRFGCKELKLISESVVSDSNAMTYIGQSNYAANTLLADATWREAICKSRYFESVLNVKVPVMTSNTTPSGRVFAVLGFKTAANGYKAFDGDASTSAQGVDGLTHDCAYEFPTAVTIYKLYHAVAYFKTVKFQYSDDSSTWTDVNSVFTYNTMMTGEKRTEINNTNFDAHKYWRFYGTQESAGSGYFNEIQFYGREDV